MSRAQPAPAVAGRRVDLPDDLPGPNDIVRALFHDRGEVALEVRTEGAVLQLMPWCARHGGVAGFERRHTDAEARPVERTGDEVRRLLETHDVREVPLSSTPAAELAPAPPGQPAVSWHARVRWAERIEPVTDPAPRVRNVWRRGFQVGVPRGYGRYSPVDDAVVCYVGPTYAEARAVTTVFLVEDVDANDDVGANHLDRCRLCGEVWNPHESSTCAWCGAPSRAVARRQLLG